MSAFEARAHGNRIVGEPAAGSAGGELSDSDRGGGRFEVLAASDGVSLGTWPRSGVDALQAALGALSDARGALAGLRADERRARAADALERLERDGELARWLALRLAVAPDELAAHRRDLAARAAAHLDAAEDAEVSPPGAGGARGGAGLGLVLPDWSELVLGTAVATLAELCAGRPALVLADPRTPAVCDAVVRALEGAGFPARSAAVLHGGDATLVRAAVRDPRIGRASVSGSPERLREVHAAAAARPSNQPLVLFEDVPRGVALELGADAPRRVAEVVARAFGRAATLSGQLPGRVETVRVPVRAFSAFTEALLAALATDPDSASPVPLIDRGALAAFQEVCGLGLDEGAALIHGGIPRLGSAGNGGGRENGGAHAPVVAPAVFTNVEPGMQLLERPAPGPLLRLVRRD